MTIEDTVALLTLALGLPAIVLQIVRQLGRTSPRERLLQDIQIRKELDVDSEARKAMDQHICNEVRKLTGDDPKRRDPLGIAIALVLFGAGIGLAIAAFMNGGAWWALAVPAGIGLLLGVAGLIQDGAKRERDEQGRPV